MPKSAALPSASTRNKLAFVVASLMMFLLPFLVFKFVRNNFTKDNTIVVAAVVGSVFFVKACFLVYVFCFDPLNFPGGKPGKAKQD